MLRVAYDLRLDLDTHLAGCAAESTECGLFAAGIHVLHLDFDEIHDLLLGELGHLDLVWLLGAGSDTGSLLEENSCWGLLGDEGEALVFVDRDDNRENIPGLLLSCCVELFAESHDVHTLLTERGTYWRRWIGLSGRDLKLDLSCDFFGHGLGFCLGSCLVLKACAREFFLRQFWRKRVVIKSEPPLKGKRFLDFLLRNPPSVDPPSSFFHAGRSCWIDPCSLDYKEVMLLRGSTDTDRRNPSSMPPSKGALLVALPALMDAHFRRTILFLSHHDDEDGAVGFILNRPLKENLGELAGSSGGLGHVPVFEGGPVERQHLILTRLLWNHEGAHFQSLSEEDLAEKENTADLRAFTGYAGWTAGQLEREIEEKSWIVLPPTSALISPVLTQEEGVSRWKSLMKELGPWYHLLSEAPDNPSLN